MPAPRRRALVTGGGSGIGLATATALAARGDDVLVADLRDSGTGLPYVRTDATDEAAVRAAFDAATDMFGGVDLVVLCAGLAITMGFTPETVPWDIYEKQWAVNVQGIVLGIRVATPALRAAGGGSIVAMSSLAGLAPAPGDPLYSLTKFAVAGLVRSLAPMLSADHIRINAMCPGFVDTPLIDDLRDTFTDSTFPLIPVETVVDQILLASSDEGGTGECYLVQAGVEPSPYRFRGVPGARGAQGSVANVPSALGAGEVKQFLREH